LNEKEGFINPLNLTDEQYAAIKRAKTAHVKKILKLKSDAMGKQLEFKGLIGDPASNEEVIRAKGREIETINTQITRELIEYELSIRKILTTEQIRLWSEIENAPAIRKSSGR
jgi:Spy/CpxP family protein refolding chaperone